SEDRLSVNRSQERRFAGLHAQAVHDRAGRAEFAHDARREIAFADRRTAAEYDAVALLERARERGTHELAIVADARQLHHLDAERAQGGAERVAVGIANLPGLRRFAHADQFVAGRDDAEARAPEDLERRE